MVLDFLIFALAMPVSDSLRLFVPSAHFFTRELAPSSGKWEPVQQHTQYLYVNPVVMMRVVGDFCLNYASDLLQVFIHQSLNLSLVDMGFPCLLSINLQLENFPQSQLGRYSGSQILMCKRISREIQLKLELSVSAAKVLVQQALDMAQEQAHAE